MPGTEHFSLNGIYYVSLQGLNLHVVKASIPIMHGLEEA